MSITVQVPTVRGEGASAPYIIGRNGYYEITALQFHRRGRDEVGSRRVVDIQAVGKRKKLINGGFFCLQADDIDALCTQWIQARGGLAMLPGDEGVTALVTMCSGVVDEVILSTDGPTLARLGERYVGEQDPDKWCYALEAVLLLDAPEENSQ